MGESQKPMKKQVVPKEKKKQSNIKLTGNVFWC